ncbi:hypothetical protein SSZBM1_138 [Synechococcus phage S-SZBM1]|uniref:Uncharacterized protein n=1 Tax=Synechococcus phage S-SZBM1 TaxID=2926475 RepID=A0AC61TSN7_9CAUD|nr:hypothetical protein PP650_gp138 [Synechococcus phage S-SZBM1]UNH61255.1 hypothetical protein SSZBM1_138 [Synechococcus phage S-SZBM1]
MKPDQDNRVTTRKKVGNVTINPKKEDLMSESLRRRVHLGLDELKEAAKKKDKETKAKRWWDDDGDGKGWEKGEVSGSFKKEECDDDYDDTPTKADDTEAKKKSKDRMKMKMMLATADHDRNKRYGYK